jgi:hypothetical protein
MKHTRSIAQITAEAAAACNIRQLAQPLR